MHNFSWDTYLFMISHPYLLLSSDQFIHCQLLLMRPLQWYSHTLMGWSKTRQLRFDTSKHHCLTTGRTSQVSLTDRHHSFKQSTDIDEEESTANKTLNVTGKASEGSVEEVSSAIANACTLHELIIIMCACKITKTFWLKFSSIAGPLKRVS